MPLGKQMHVTQGLISVRSPGRQSTLSQYDIFTYKVVLKRPFVDDTR